MKFASLDHFGVGLLRLALVASAFSAIAAAATGVAVGGALGGAKPATMVVVGTLVFYVVVSAPRRILDRQRVVQARESVLILTAAKACLGVTGSRPRTLIELRSREAGFAKALSESARSILLGASVERATEAASRNLVSSSALASLESIATLHPDALDVDDEENRGLTESSALSRETKLPVFMTACFFSPIMLLLYAIFSNAYQVGDLAGLCALEFVILDLAFYLTAGEGGTHE